MRRIVLVLLALFVIVPAARAQSLAEHVPSDAIVYVGWRGASNLGPGYEASHLKAILDGSNIPEFFNDFLPRLVQRVQQKDLATGTKMRVAMDLGSALFRHPSAYFFSGLDMSGREPMPRAGLICQADNDADALKQQLDQLIATMGPTPVPIKAFKQAEIVGVLVGYPDVEKALPDARTNSLDESGGFKKMTMNLNADPAITAFVDGEKFLKLIDEVVAKAGNPQASAKWPKAKEATGLTGLKRIAYTAGFDGKEWMSQIFVEAPAPRRGLLAMCDNKPIAEDLLKAIPESATFVAVGSFDLAKLVEQIRSIAGAIDPEAQQKIDQGLGGLSMMIGKNVQRDILEPLGEQWGIYMSPLVGGNSYAGVVLINQLDDAAKAQQGLNAAWIFANNMIAAQMKNSELKVQTQRTKIGDVTINYLGIPFVSPGWTIKDGRLYAGLFPQVIATATKQVAAGKSITDNADYQKLLQRLNVPKASSVVFMNLPATAPQAYQTALVLTRMGLGFADMWGVKAPEPVLPPLDVLLPHLTPAMAASWTDDAGWHAKSVTPFPGASLIATEQNATVGSTALMTSIMLPSLNRARETANRIKCASNMRQIGQAIQLYANENKGSYPADLGTLMHDEDIAMDAFLCPSSNVSPPGNDVRTPDQMAQWVNEHSPYVYGGKGLKTDAPADRIVLYENLSDHDTDGGNFLYGDGHVEFLGKQAYTQEMTRIQARK
jgi:prepilin-type processing-associated H-X9-DG protein